MNLLYGGANNKIVIYHISTRKAITSLPFYRDADYIDISVLTLPLVQTMDDGNKHALEQILTQALVKKQEINIQELDKSLKELLVKISTEEKKGKENIDPQLLHNMKEQYKALLQQKQEIEKANKLMSDGILHSLLQYFIANFHIVIDGIHNYNFHSYVSMGGQGIVFRIVKESTSERHIIKFAIYNNCDEIKHEAETLENYYKLCGIPATFRPYKPLFYHDGSNDKVRDGKGVGADASSMDVGDDMGRSADIGVIAIDADIRNMCFVIYEDVGNEDLLTFIRKCNDLRTRNQQSPELVDRIKMIPSILLQIALQLEYYKKYRHNDIRLENIVVDVRNVTDEQEDLMEQVRPVGSVEPIYRGTALELVRVTIIDFGKCDKPDVLNFSLAYIASPEALEHEFMKTFRDKQGADLIGFCWVAIDLLTLSQAGYIIMEKTLIGHVLSNEQNHEIIAHDLGTRESIKRKALLFIYQSLMYNSLKKSPMSSIFESMVIDNDITFSKLLKLIERYYKIEILQILFQKDKKKYNSFIMNLLSLLASIDNRPNIQQLKNTLEKFVETTS
jgi:serine/threonine protein kinase